MPKWRHGSPLASPRLWETVRPGHAGSPSTAHLRRCRSPREGRRARTSAISAFGLLTVGAARRLSEDVRHKRCRGGGEAQMSSTVTPAGGEAEGGFVQASGAYQSFKCRRAEEHVRADP